MSESLLHTVKRNVHVLLFFLKLKVNTLMKDGLFCENNSMLDFPSIILSTLAKSISITQCYTPSVISACKRSCVLDPGIDGD